MSTYSALITQASDFRLPLFLWCFETMPLSLFIENDFSNTTWGYVNLSTHPFKYILSPGHNSAKLTPQQSFAVVLFESLEVRFWRSLNTGGY